MYFVTSSFSTIWSQNKFTRDKECVYNGDWPRISAVDSLRTVNKF